jgi:hypothetical protein
MEGGLRGAMRRLRIEKPRVRREHGRAEALEIDPRDPDIVRAKAMARSGGRRLHTTKE